MFAFAGSLQPHLDGAPYPPAEIGALAAAGQEVHDWTNRDRVALLRARADELLRWMALDRAAVTPPRNAPP